MSKIAVDTNILLYALDEIDINKQNISLSILAGNTLFCSQSLSEFTNVCLRKWKFSKSKVAKIIKIYCDDDTCNNYC